MNERTQKTLCKCHGLRLFTTADGLTCTFPSILAGWFDHNVDKQFVRQASSAIFGFHFEDEVVLDGIIQWLCVVQYTYNKHHN